MNREQIRQYAVSAVVAAVLTALFMAYLSAQTGSSSLSALNKSIAGTSFALVGIVLLLGPLSRLYNRFDRWINYRKELGIAAFVLGAIHVYFAMFPLARRGPFGFYLARPWSAFPGLTGLLIMAFLFLFSLESMKKRLPAAAWWKLQYWGVRVTGLALLVHVAVLRFSAWKTVFSDGPGTLPPLNALIGLFGAFVLLVRLSEFLGQRIARAIVPLGAATALGIGVMAFLR